MYSKSVIQICIHHQQIHSISEFVILEICVLQDVGHLYP
jgi:hypothetical protein